MTSKVIMVILLAVLAIGTTGCLSSATKTHLHTKVDEVELRTKDLVEANLDEVVLEILVKLNERLVEKEIEVPEELKEILVAEAQKIAREYALKGVEVGFDEIHALIDKIFPEPAE